MKTKPCKDCGQRVSTRARACPSCGAPTVSQGKAFLAGCFGLLVMVLVIWSLIPSPTPEDPAARQQRLAEEAQRDAERKVEYDQAAASSRAQAAERTTQLLAALQSLDPGGALIARGRAEWHEGNVVEIVVLATWHDQRKSSRVESATALDQAIARIAAGDLTTWTARDPAGQKVAGRGLFGMSVD